MKEMTTGLEKLIGSRVLIMCAGYFYEGKLMGVYKTCVRLEDPAIVYSSGVWSDKSYEDIQKLHVNEWFVRKNLIESFGLSKNV